MNNNKNKKEIFNKYKESLNDKKFLEEEINRLFENGMRDEVIKVNIIKDDDNNEITREFYTSWFLSFCEVNEEIIWEYQGHDDYSDLGINKDKCLITINNWLKQSIKFYEEYLNEENSNKQQK